MLRLFEFLAKRLFSMFLTLLAVSAIIFSLTQMLPGTAADMALGQFATDESVQALEEELGLDRPYYIQYIDWLSGLVTGNLGTSHQWGEPVSGLVLSRAMNSLYLTVVGSILTVGIGVPLGIIAALRRDSILDTIISGSTYFGVSVPDFVSGTILILLGATYLQIFPATSSVSSGAGNIERAHALVLPTLTLMLLATAHVVRQTRNGMVDVLESDYVRSARLRGLSPRQVVIKHALRNGILPAITVIAFSFGWMLGGLVIVETVFAYPGVGRLAVTAIQNRDIPVLQAVMMLLAAAFVIANTTADVLYTQLDPRIDYTD